MALLPPDTRADLTLVLLVAFLFAWLYTEISEYFERDAFHQEVNDFMHKGDRFTQAEGDALEARIDALQAECCTVDRVSQGE